MTTFNLAEHLGIACPSPEQSVSPDWHHAGDYQLSVKRDDLLHPHISGNKWRKLKYALTNYLSDEIKELVSFGGGYSNHLHALAYACSKLNIELTAIVRGNYQNNLTPMLKDIMQWGTKVQFVDRAFYQQRYDAIFLDELRLQHPGAEIVPEGGSQQAALQGVQEVITELQHNYDYILAPVGSGGTLAGLIAAQTPAKILGIAVLKGQAYLEQLVTQLLPVNNIQDNWQIHHDYHCGGYAKRSPELIAFCESFCQAHAIPLEPVYSGKLFFAAKQLVEQQWFPAGSRILLLHTGGLQGNRRIG